MTPLAAKAAAVLPPIALKIFDEIGIVAAIVLSLTAMVLHWHMPRHRMTVEERVKDGRLTEKEARRQVDFYRWCAPALTLISILVLLLVLFDLSR